MFRKHFRRKSTAESTEETASADSLRMSTKAATKRQRLRPRTLVDCRSLKSACNLIALILILLVHKVSENQYIKAQAQARTRSNKRKRPQIQIHAGVVSSNKKREEIQGGRNIKVDSTHENWRWLRAKSLDGGRK